MNAELINLLFGGNDTERKAIPVPMELKQQFVDNLAETELGAKALMEVADFYVIYNLGKARQLVTR